MLNATPTGGWRQFASYWKEGVWHIWIGLDHMLFLLALLLPSVLWWENGRWRPATEARPVLLDTAAIITAFTLAHSLTLTLAVLGVVNLPSRLVESAIAFTVVLAALNNLFPVVKTRRWALAFALGLVHGFGFASVLRDFGLPADALVLALAGFNLGWKSGNWPSSRPRCRCSFWSGEAGCIGVWRCRWARPSSLRWLWSGVWSAA